MEPLKRLRAGSYETLDGKFFTYRVTDEHGSNLWMLYRANDEGGELIACDAYIQGIRYCLEDARQGSI